MPTGGPTLTKFPQAGPKALSSMARPALHGQEDQQHPDHRTGKGKTPCVVALDVLPCSYRAYLSGRLTWAHPGAILPSSLPSVGPRTPRQMPRPVHRWFDHGPSRVCEGTVNARPTPWTLERQGAKQHMPRHGSTPILPSGSNTRVTPVLLCMGPSTPFMQPAPIMC
jgi:hypothetical protein